MAAEQGTDLAAIAQVIGGLSGAITPPVLIWLLIKRVFVSGEEVKQLLGQLDAKDAALERKDEQIQALNKGLVDTAIPAITRATSILEHFHTDTTVRRSD